MRAKTSPFMVPSDQSTERQPLHVAISEKLNAQIEAGQYAPGARLPSEFELGQLFDVSRTTIRRAIASLIQQGLVTTQQGKGIFVTQRHKISFSMSNPLMYFDAALKQQGYTGRVHSLRFQQIKAPLDVAQKLQLPSSKRSAKRSLESPPDSPLEKAPESSQSSHVYWQEKIIYADDTPIALDITYYPRAIGDRLAGKLRDGFTYSTLAGNGVALTAAQVRLEGVPATYELSEYLAVPLGMPLLVFNYIAFSAKSQPVVCGITLARSDWTCYSAQIETAPL